MFQARYAILLDGGFVTKKLQQKHGHPATADEIVEFCDVIQGHDALKNYELLRIYYYDAPPSQESLSKPVSKERMELAKTERFKHAQSLYDQLELKPGFALRMGETRVNPNKWKMSKRAIGELVKGPRNLTDDDFHLDINQKGVDMRIGLDMARLTLRDLVRAVVVVTGDSDFIPAFKFVRREGVKVMLSTMGHHSARRDLKVHSDFVID